MCVDDELNKESRQSCSIETGFQPFVGDPIKRLLKVEKEWKCAFFCACEVYDSHGYHLGRPVRNEACLVYRECIFEMGCDSICQTLSHELVVRVDEGNRPVTRRECRGFSFLEDRADSNYPPCVGANALLESLVGDQGKELGQEGDLSVDLVGDAVSAWCRARLFLFCCFEDISRCDCVEDSGGEFLW